jgi:hypothetical protein
MTQNQSLKNINMTPSFILFLCVLFTYFTEISRSLEVSEMYVQSAAGFPGTEAAM